MTLLYGLALLVGWMLTLCSQNLLAWNDMLGLKRVGQKKGTVNTVHLNTGLC